MVAAELDAARRSPTVAAGTQAVDPDAGVEPAAPRSRTCQRRARSSWSTVSTRLLVPAAPLRPGPMAPAPRGPGPPPARPCSGASRPRPRRRRPQDGRSRFPGPRGGSRTRHGSTCRDGCPSGPRPPRAGSLRPDPRPSMRRPNLPSRQITEFIAQMGSQLGRDRDRGRSSPLISHEPARLRAERSLSWSARPADLARKERAERRRAEVIQSTRKAADREPPRRGPRGRDRRRAELPRGRLRPCRSAEPVTVSEPLGPDPAPRPRAAAYLTGSRPG